VIGWAGVAAAQDFTPAIILPTACAPTERIRRQR